MARYNAYTLQELDDALKKNPTLKRLPQLTRFGLYNLIQTMIWELKPRKDLTHNVTIVDNTFGNDSSRKTLFVITQKNLPDWRNSLFTLGDCIRNMQRNNLFKKLNNSQQIFVFNLAQQSVINIKNQNNDEAYIVDTASVNRFGALPIDMKIYLDSYPILTLVPTARKSSINGNLYFDSYAIVKTINSGLSDNDIYFDSYAILSIFNNKLNSNNIYFDSYPQIILMNFNINDFDFYFDSYPTMTVTS